eukprot:TRINITY_DN743_c0_g1_i2.p1 TRINITY_DN743_c0_g1~~TRINITY_DN743_c0_g1_i2.p1  ORF type:complete len:237 (+),score=50.90 TRINITY_DN743_c0_g1_i2:33-743(+)
MSRQKCPPRKRSSHLGTSCLTAQEGRRCSFAAMSQHRTVAALLASCIAMMAGSLLFVQSGLPKGRPATVSTPSGQQQVNVASDLAAEHGTSSSAAQSVFVGAALGLLVGLAGVAMPAKADSGMDPAQYDFTGKKQCDIRKKNCTFGEMVAETKAVFAASTASDTFDKKYSVVTTGGGPLSRWTVWEGKFGRGKDTGYAYIGLKERLQPYVKAGWVREYDWNHNGFSPNGPYKAVDR